MMKLFALLGKEKKALESIFNSYLKSPKYDPTGHSLKNRNRNSTTSHHLGSSTSTSKLPRSPCSVPTNHLFNTASTSFSTSFNRSLQSDGGDMNDRYTSSSTQFGGVSLEGIKQFAKDFDLLPVVIEASVLFEIFVEILENPRYLSMNSFSSSARNSSERNCNVDIGDDRDRYEDEDEDGAAYRDRNSNKDRDSEDDGREFERGLRNSHSNNRQYNNTSSPPSCHLSNTELISEIDDVYSTHSVKNLRPLSSSFRSQIQKNTGRDMPICDIEEPLLTLSQVRVKGSIERALSNFSILLTERKKGNASRTFRCHLS